MEVSRIFVRSPGTGVIEAVGAGVPIMDEARKESHVADQPEAPHEGSGLKVIGAGFGRTGTFSLKIALEELGFGPCYHMIEVPDKPGATEQWDAIARGAPADWHRVFAGYQATVDWPACTFYTELMQAYPDAKVLLTVRDPEQWYESASRTIYPVTHRDPLSLHARMVNTLVWEGTFAGTFEEQDSAIAVFLQHSESVKQQVPPEKLLVYDVKEGWEPLCAFLGVAASPEKAFPHRNDRANFLGNVRTQRHEG
jgi:sulfotransferase family protein